MKDNLFVIHLIHWADSGIGVFVKRLVESHRTSGVNSKVIAWSCSESMDDKMTRCGIEVINCHESWTTLFRHLRNLLKSSEAEISEATIVHTHSLSPMIFGLLCGLHGGGPITYLRTIHNRYPYFTEGSIRSRIKRAVEGCALKRMDVTTCVSQHILFDMPWSNISINTKVVINGVPVPSRLEDESIRIKLGFSADDLVFVNVGRLSPEKGHSALVDAFRSVSQRHCNLRLIICGGGPEFECLKRRAKSYGLDNKVVFLGQVEDPTVFLQLSDCYICSSRHEGYPLSIAEAMMAGLPVITTPIGDMAESVDSFKLGKKLSGCEVVDLEKGLEWAIAGHENLADIGKNANSFAREHLDVRLTANRYLDLYRNAI